MSAAATTANVAMTEMITTGFAQAGSMTRILPFSCRCDVERSACCRGVTGAELNPRMPLFDSNAVSRDWRAVVAHGEELGAHRFPMLGSGAAASRTRACETKRL